MSKSCSPKSKYINNPQYECGANGRYHIKAEFKKKRTPSGYNLYTKAQYHIVNSQLGSKLGKKPSLGEVSHALGQQWKKMKKSDKNIYIKEALKLKTQLGGAIDYYNTENKNMMEVASSVVDILYNAAYNLQNVNELGLPMLEVNESDDITKYIITRNGSNWNIISLPQEIEFNINGITELQSYISLIGRRIAGISYRSGDGNSNILY